MQRFKAFRIHNDDQGYRAGLEEITLGDLMPGEVLIECRFSSVNYKDALAASPTGKVVRHFPINGGIDCAGAVVESTDARFRPGDEVLATGYGLGVSHDGGYARYVRLPAVWLLPMPAYMGPFHTMVLGTAGFTAAMCVDKIVSHGVKPEAGEILVTGATGGVGSIAVALLAKFGYNVVAATGKVESAARFLTELGAASIISREDASDDSGRPLLRPRWAGVVDTVGGDMLATALASAERDAAISICGLVASATLQTTVLPFILRGITLYGIDSVEISLERKKRIWGLIAGSYKLENLEALVREVGLEQLSPEIDKILAGGQTGRILLKHNF